MDSLPLELIERILKHCDGASFARLSRVCMKWKWAQENIEASDERIWRRFCFDEIEPQVIDEINANKNTSYQQMSQQTSKRIYRTWWTTKQLSRWQSNETHFASEEELSAIKVSGKLNDTKVFHK